MQTDPGKIPYLSCKQLRSVWSVLIMPLLLVLLAAVLAACTLPEETQRGAPKTEQSYFDPHTHLSGVLPWQAYINLPAYLAQLQEAGPGVTFSDKLEFYHWLVNDWYAAQKNKMGDGPFSSHSRIGLGAKATLELLQPASSADEWLLDGALERLYTATPFTEFDSAYALRNPARQWLQQRFYDGDARTVDDALCTAQILELARAGIGHSEQSVSFVGGWRQDDKGYSSKLASVRCAAERSQQLAPLLEQLGLPQSQMRILLMTHTHELGKNAAGDAFQTFEGSGQCHWESLPQAITLNPETIYQALLGQDAQGQLLVAARQKMAFFDALAGIDTAAPEMTCFTGEGMEHYQALIRAVLRAAKARREQGWHGKLLVHTHVGEGFTTYYGQQPLQRPWSFSAAFGELPALTGNVVRNGRVPENNITRVLDAIAQARRNHPDLDNYLVIRLGHVTHATREQAHRMAELQVEADINLNSNLATGSWPLSKAPAADTLVPRLAAMAANPEDNFQLNNLSGFLMPDPHDSQTVASVLGTHPLRHLLMAGVRVMLSTDGGGVEHSSMAREYALADSLIRHWRATDAEFVRQASDVSMQTFDDNVAWHLSTMQDNNVWPYFRAGVR